MIGMRQGQEPLGPQPLLSNLLGRHGGQFFPRLHAVRQFGPHALLDRLATGHGDALGRAITQVIPLLQELHLPIHDFGLGGRHSGYHLVEILLDHDWGVAGGRLLGHETGLMPENGTKHQNAEDHQSGTAHTNCTCESSFHLLP